MVDRGLASDGGVDLTEHGRRQRDEIRAPHVRRRHEAREIAHRASAERQQGRRAIGARGEQPIPAVLGHGQRLGRLAFGHLEHHDRQTGGLEARDDGSAVQLEDAGIGDEHRARADA